MVTKLPRLTTGCEDGWSVGARWLANAAPHPADVLAAWERREPARFPVPEHWAVAEAELVTSMTVMPLLGRAGKLGPLLVDISQGLAWWLVPADARDHLGDLAPRVRVRQTSWPLHCPEPGTFRHGRGWVHQPDGTGELTCPAALGAAVSGRVHLPDGVVS